MRQSFTSTQPRTGDGDGLWSADELAQALAARDRKACGPGAGGLSAGECVKVDDGEPGYTHNDVIVGFVPIPLLAMNESRKRAGSRACYPNFSANATRRATMGLRGSVSGPRTVK
jgi:hypothetical protein